MSLHRRELLGAAGGLILGGLGMWLGQRLVTMPSARTGCDPSMAPPIPSDIYTWQEALARLQAGNRRAVEGRGQVAVPLPTPLLTRDARPIAAILTCSDARLPCEAIFDERGGDLFILRQPALLVEAGAFAALEYAIDFLRVPLVLILGHTHCTALNAALTVAENPDTPTPPGLAHLTKELGSVIKDAVGTPENRLDRLLTANVRHVVRQVRSAPAIRDALNRRVTLREPTVLIQGALCDQATGLVSLVELP